MGLLDLFRKKPKSIEPNVSVRVMVRGKSGEMIDADSDEAKREWDEWQRGERERKRAYDAEQAANRSFLEGAGVDVSAFSPERVLADARDVVSSACPPMGVYCGRLQAAEPDIVFSAPTKTGKVPKNVVVVHIATETMVETPGSTHKFKEVDNIIIHLRYLADGSVNMADIYGWHEKIGQGVLIRRIDGELRIVEIRRTSPEGIGTWETLFKDQKPVDNGTAVARLEDSVAVIFSH